MKYPYREEAVSPVIATVLMITVTVVIAAVIASYTFGFAQTTTSNSKFIGIIATNYTSNGVTFTIHGGEDIQDLIALDIIQGGTTTPWAGLTPKAGDTFTVPVSSHPVTVVGTFNDGTSQVMWMDNAKATPLPPPLDKNVVVNPKPRISFGLNYVLGWTFSGSGTGNIQTITAIDGNGATVADDTMAFDNVTEYAFAVLKTAYSGTHIIATFTDGSTQTLYTWT